MMLPSGLRGCRGVVLDTNILIYCFEDDAQYGGLASHVLDQAIAGAFEAVVTPITLAEILVKPLKSNRGDVADRYRSALASLPHVTLVNMDTAAGAMAGALRAKYNLPLPDMLQAAVALQSRTPVVITQDKLLKRVDEVRVLQLEDFA